MDFAPDSDPETLATSPPPALHSPSPADQSEIEDYLDTYQYASEPSYFTRPNRYYGPPSTWRSWTANDRAVAESLEVIRASDLSIHLYNAFNLKQRNGSAPHARHHEIKAHDRNGVASNDDQQVADQEFTPPEVWTAWPLSGRYVPRNSTPHDVGDHSRIRTQRTNPSTTLEDALLATTLRHARQKWEARKTEPKPSQARLVSHHWKSEHDPGKRELKNSATAEEERHNTASPRPADGGGTPDSGTDPYASDAVLMEENLPEGVQFFSSQAFAMADSSSSEDEMSTTNSEEEHPMFLADDDLAHNLLEPSTRHLLAKLDDLLDGLHKARIAYAVKGGNASSRSQSRSVFSDTERTEDERYVRSGSRAASKKRGRKRSRSRQPSDSGQLKNSISRGRSTVRVSDKKNQAYGLRDWSDVLGMATLTGWNVETVARASERCARLFGQNMMFRTFHQGSIDGDVASQEAPWFEEEVAYAPAANEGDALIPSQASFARTRLESRQNFECVRTSPICPRCQQHKIRCDPPKVMSSVDFTQPVPCAPCSSIPNLDAPCPGIMIRPQSKAASKTCPYPDCARHDLTKSFAKNYHLQRHLTDVHGHIYSPPASPMMKDLARDDRFNSTAEEQIRPSVNLTCPITSCPQSTRMYKRSTRLYDHIRKMHPEFDVASFKKIIAKGSGRGRYDRSRSNSRARALAQVDNDDDIIKSPEKDEERSEDEAEQSRESENGIGHEMENSD